VKLLLALDQEQADAPSRHRAMEAKIERAEQELQQAAAAYQAYRQGERLDYSLRDAGSGLAVYRAVIEDEDERYPKVVWTKTLSSSEWTTACCGMAASAMGRRPRRAANTTSP